MCSEVGVAKAPRAWTLRLAVVLGACGLLVACGGGGSMPPPNQSPPPAHPNLTRVSTDPFQNASSQHQTEVEPSLVAVGSTVVAAFQAGRFFTAGSSDIDFATSRDAGATWTAGSLPGLSKIVTAGSPFDSVSDPVVAFDAKHQTWLIASLPVTFNGSAGGAAVSRSSDGVTWSAPVFINMADGASDKTWIACDDTSTSPFYGNCYLEYDEGGTTGLINMYKSSDGGMTWSGPAHSADMADGIGGQPMVQPNGTLIVPIDDFFETRVLSFVSHDGGNTYTSSVLASNIFDHFENGGLRSGPLISAAMDAAGKAYVVWEDCSFRQPSCATNDIVLITSTDGLSWSAPTRIPIDATSSSVDHFLPGLSIAPNTAGAGAQLALVYYYYPVSACDTNGNPACQLLVGFIGSTDGGTTWGAPQTLAGPMSLPWIANTLLGPMIGDYFATTFAGGQPLAIFAVGDPPVGGLLQEAMWVPKPGTLVLRSAAQHVATAAGCRRFAHADHPPYIQRRRIP